MSYLCYISATHSTSLNILEPVNFHAFAVTGHSRLLLRQSLSLSLSQLHSTENQRRFLGMASIVANLPLPILINGAKPSLKPRIFPVSALPERRGRVGVIVRASSDGSDSSTSLSIIESVQNVWDKPEDRIAVIGLGFTAIIAFWASLNLVAAIDKLPVIPGFFEFVGILFSSWFVYRNLLFKPDREQLFRNINQSVSNILGQ